MVPSPVTARRTSRPKFSPSEPDGQRQDAARGTAPLFIDWAKEAQIAADDLVRSDADAARRAAGLSQWKSHVMPAPIAAGAPQFSWDYAATHRLESSPHGLVVNLNDRCSLLISVSAMAVMGGCKLGELPVHGNLFMHMKDEPAPGPATR